MENKATIPFWSADAFLYFVMDRDFHSDWSSELISRTSTFIDAYILFEKIVLPERYKKDSTLKKIDPNGTIFEYIKSDDLVNSDNLTTQITIDLSLNYTEFSTLHEEDYKWFAQHTGHVTKDDYEDCEKQE